MANNFAEALYAGRNDAISSRLKQEEAEQSRLMNTLKIEDAQQTRQTNQQQALFNLAKGYKNYVTQNPEGGQQYYDRFLAPSLSSMGFEVGPYDANTVGQVADQVLAAYDGAQSAGSVQSTYVDNQGNRVAIMRDGTQQVLGPNQAATQLVEGPGGYYSVNRNSAQASPVTLGGGAPQSGAYQTPTGVVRLGDDLSPEQREAALADAALGGMGGSIQLPERAATPSRQLQAAPRAPAAPSALNERVSAARSLGATDDEIKRMVVGGEGARDAQRISAKDATTARQKLTQIQTARQQLASARQNFNALKGSFSAGLGGQYLPTPEGQAFDRAVANLAPLITAVTRVPGIGAMSDYESRLQNAALPSRGTYENVTEQQFNDLERLLDTVESGYNDLLAPGQAPAGPADEEDDIDSLLDKYR